MPNSRVILVANNSSSNGRNAEIRATFILEQNAGSQVELATFHGKDKDAIDRLFGSGSSNRTNESGRLGKTYSNCHGEAIMAKAAQINAGLAIIPWQGGQFFTKLFQGYRIVDLLEMACCPVLIVKNKAKCKYRNVLIATDFSDGSRTAALAALEIAPDAQVTVIHAYTLLGEPLIRTLGLKENFINRYRKQAALQAEIQLAKFIKSIGRGRRMNRILMHGTPICGIEKHCELHAVDLLVLGASLKARMNKQIAERKIKLGAITKRAIDQTPIDLLIASDHFCKQ